MAALPAGISALSKLGGALTIGAGAAAIFNGIRNNLPNNPALQNQYTSNQLWQFPSDLPKINGEMFCMLLQFYKYDRPSILNAPTLIPYGAIALPIPNDLIDKSSQSYSEEGSHVAVTAGLEGLSTSHFATVSQALESFEAQAGINAINNVATKLGDSSTTARVLQFGGVAQNPFLSILFNSPTFKRHSFSWTCIPETGQDTETLNFILNKLRYHSMPDIAASTGGVLLTYPDMCVPVLIPQGFMYDFKQCVIEAISINYAVGDTPAFNTKQAPNAIRFSITLLEIEYWVKSDLLNTSSSFGTGSPDSAIGTAPYGSAG